MTTTAPAVLTAGLAITDEHTITRITVKHGHRVVGIVEGSDERGYVAEYWWPAVNADGNWYGPYETEHFPQTFDGPQGRANALGWLSDVFNVRPTGRALGAPTLTR
jgi:hypothetical protein